MGGAQPQQWPVILILGIVSTHTDHRPIAELRPSAATASLDGAACSATRSMDIESAPDDYDLALSGTSVTQDTKQLMDPKFRRTSRRAEDISIVGAVLTWNLSVRSSSCCPYHAYLVEAHKALSRLFVCVCVSGVRRACDGGWSSRVQRRVCG